MSASVKTISQQLRAHFDHSQVQFKPQAVRGGKALAIAYVDARTVMDRLDVVFGVDGWWDSYEFVDGEGYICRLTCVIDDNPITKTDFGSESEQGDSGDRHKAAVSDALKRAAVKFGVGRYLYNLPKQWVDYDPQKKQFTQKPKLPPVTRPDQAPTSIPKTDFVTKVDAAIDAFAEIGVPVVDIERMLGHLIESVKQPELDKIRHYYQYRLYLQKVLETVSPEQAAKKIQSLDPATMGQFQDEFEIAYNRHIEQLQRAVAAV